MHIPEKRVCDLCRADLTGGYVSMSYPLNEADRAALKPQVQSSVPAIFRGMMDVTPRAWRFDFCRGCADGFMPMLEELKTNAVKAWIAECERRAAAPVGERED